MVLVVQFCQVCARAVEKCMLFIMPTVPVALNAEIRHHLAHLIIRLG